jgi:type II secretory pathway pseudopilin PulG
MIEMIVVIGIVGGLAAVLFTSFNTTMKKARDGRRKADLGIIQTAIENYKMDFGEYPENNNPCAANDPHPCEVPTTITYTDADDPSQNVTYLNNTPKDPLANKPNSQYYYCYVPSANSPRLSYTLSAVFELETSECPGQPTGTPTPSPRPTVPTTPIPTPTWITPTPTLPTGVCENGGICYTLNSNGGSCCTNLGKLYTNTTCAADGFVGLTSYQNPELPPIIDCSLPNCPSSDPEYYPRWRQISDFNGCSNGGQGLGQNCRSDTFGCGSVIDYCVVPDNECLNTTGMFYKKTSCICL